MSTGIPCCKTFTITIGPNAMDCGSAQPDIGSLVWTFTNGVEVGNTGDSATSGSASGAGGTFSFTGTSGQADGTMYASFCNNTTSPVTLQFSFNVTFNLTRDYANCDLDPYATISSGDFYSGSIWSSGVGSGSATPSFQVTIPPCTTQQIGFYLAGSFNCATNTVSFNGSFTVAIV